MKIGIINVTGYAGIELARILYRHPEAEVVSVTGRSQAGEELGDALPHLSRMDITIEPEITRSVDVVFSALPQVASAEACVPFARDGVKVVDISADFRLHDPDEYARWYGAEHPAPDLLETSVYGLTELDRDGISSAQLVANPGCYPTAALLALAPVVEKGLIGEQIVVDCKSGVSGAGRGLSMTTHFSEVNENVFAYSVGGHRHLPEITQELRRIKDGYAPKVLFQPHLIPMTRGILDTIYADFVDGVFGSVEEASASVTELYREYYRDEPFVKVTDKAPQTKQTWGNNDCLVYPTVDRHTGKLVVFSALDNLVKGAAGQAVQNMNLMFGLPEATGLEQLAIYP
ncbi:MAG: N-acetyl-gamma-glutamyl-phosphate reductase [Chloroflexi bacterium]|nr:N-acetyl-gamma-glutamyl-phosphate reductase [Chloroflexota bacterium]